MTLTEALSILNQDVAADAARERIFLACGSTPLHLQTFLAAHARQQLPGRAVEVLTGLYDDLIGNIERAARVGTATAVVIEWADLDQRLGIRHSGGWGATAMSDAVAEASGRLSRIEALLHEVASVAPVAICAPTLPLPPIGHMAGGQMHATELALSQLITAFLTRCAAHPSLRIVSHQRLDAASSVADRLDVKMTLATGFPYRQRHADSIARALVDLLFPSPAKKGLIVDLDNTLWSGIVGEIGVDAVCWDLARRAQVHGWLQQATAALAESGVLVAVASKNDPGVVGDAFKRSDLLIDPSVLFPVEVNWGPKSASVARILSAWNITADSVVFIDDSPMELTEVQSAHPGIHVEQFTPHDPERVWVLLWRLKDLFGRNTVTDEDKLRLASLRAATTARDLERADGRPRAEFVAGLNATVTLDYRLDPEDRRAFELVNKTNQFNLNGRRYTESEWRAAIARPDAFLVRVSYQDKFGPLGKIASVVGTKHGDTLSVDCWVMSCRAFSRQIEHHTLDRLFAHFTASNVRLNYQATDRNMPLQEFLGTIATGGVAPAPVIAADQFRQSCQSLPHKVVEIDG